ncbi:MAG TPA: LamG-like jellyroll fold domain-containing protein, partial [Arachidicoccus sp.]|nr:LamG-like jellyroll fold domain-containing protein [Arachidicoccus sp.]
GVTGTTKGTTGPDGSLYTSQSQTGLTNNGYGTIMGAQSAYDADNDGMPDYWEAVYGSDSLTDDAMTLAPDGYTNLEHYLNWLADPNASTTPNQAVNIDLTKYAGEFALEGGVFAFSNVISGSCSLLPDGHTVQFTPAANFAGLGAFDFSVTTPDGVYQSRVSIAITATPIYSTLPVAVSAPSPGDNQAFSGAVSTSQRLSWQGGYNTDSYKIYFGTSAASLTQVSQIPFTQSATYEVSDLRFNTTYYWKVDAVGPDGTAPGQIWSFTTGPQTKLTARYKLDESTGTMVEDASENHINGLANFTPQWYPDGGNLKGAVGFAQATEPTSALVIPSSEATLLDSSSFTVSFWVKIPSNTYTYANGKDCYLINKGSFEANTGKWYGLQLKDGKLTFAIDDGAHKSSLSVSLSGTNDIFDNSWKNIVAVRDAGLNEISIYINGLKAGSASSASTKGTIGQMDKPLLIGNSGENKPYRDLMDDIRFYDNALSAQDIEDIYRMKDAVTLPVALVSFTTDIAGKGVLLKWQAAAEANSDRFELQSSTDYRTFRTLEVVKAKAKPVGLVSYTYRDQNPVNGINYYRLITYDQNGKGIVSAIKTVFFAFGKEDFTVFPNPASGGVVNFKLSSFSGKTTFSAMLLSPEGSLITKADFNVNQNNKYTLNINRRLQPGIYVLVIEHEGVMLSRKVIFRGN